MREVSALDLCRPSSTVGPAPCQPPAHKVLRALRRGPSSWPPRPQFDDSLQIALRSVAPGVTSYGVPTNTELVAPTCPALLMFTGPSMCELVLRVFLLEDTSLMHSVDS